MKGADTNVLVRYLVEDDPAQCRKARAFVDGVLEGGEELFLPQVVMCELVWVLSAAYGFRRVDIAAILDDVLRSEGIVVEDADLVARAADAYATSRADFADHLLGEQGRHAGCSAVGTFDRSLVGRPPFVAL